MLTVLEWTATPVTEGTPLFSGIECYIVPDNHTHDVHGGYQASSFPIGLGMYTHEAKTQQASTVNMTLK